MDTELVMLDVAADGDTIGGADLQASIDALLAMADALAALIVTAPDVAAVQAIGRAQLELTTQATALVTAQIRLMAGEARVTADHIDAAAQYALDVVDQIKAWKKAVAVVADVIGFFGVVLTGNGAAIVKAAVTLKGQLDAA